MPDRRPSAFDPMLEDLGAIDLVGVRVAAWPAARTVMTMAYRGEEGTVAEVLGRFARNTPAVTMLQIGPGTWLSLCDGAFPDLGDAAATFDQGDGFAFLKLNGSAAMTVLQKGIFVDLEAGLASVGACVCSVIGYINVIAWRASPDTIAVAVPRSFAGSFWHWLRTAAAAEGVPIGR